MLPASFMRMERFWCNIATYVINLLFSLTKIISVKHTINTQINRVGCNIAPKSYRLHEVCIGFISWHMLGQALGSSKLDA